MLAGEPAEADRLLKLRDAVLPEGLKMILRSYRAQARVHGRQQRLRYGSESAMRGCDLDEDRW
jgi:hypothetical protein